MDPEKGLRYPWSKLLPGYITAHPELGIIVPGRQINRRTVYIYHKTEAKITF